MFSSGLTDVKASLESIVATPTIENATAQGEKLALDALNPSTLQSNTLQSVAQEALNVINYLDAHVATAAAAPSVVTPAAS